MPLDSDASAFLRRLAEQGGAPLHELSPLEVRDTLAATARAGGAPEPVAEITDRQIPGPHGEIPVRVYVPNETAPRPAVLYFHGGGWVAGNLDSVETTCTMLANRAGAAVVSVDYRLAPEHKFPTAVDDCYAATRWVSHHADELAIDARRVAVAGDSAGGNLAAAVATVARDIGTPNIAFQVLFYPVTSMNFGTASYRENGQGYFLTTQMMRWFWKQYLDGESDAQDVRASPLLVPDASGLPPAFVVTAKFDPLRDEGEAYAELLRSAGNAVWHRRYEGQIHGFATRPGVMRAGRQAIEEAAFRLCQAFGTTLSSRRPVDEPGKSSGERLLEGTGDD